MKYEKQMKIMHCQGIIARMPFDVAEKNIYLWVKRGEINLKAFRAISRFNVDRFTHK